MGVANVKDEVVPVPPNAANNRIKAAPWAIWLKMESAPNWM